MTKSFKKIQLLYLPIYYKDLFLLFVANIKENQINS